MSNLSELLPAGGGGKNVDFVASGTLGNGKTVVLKANGTVELVAETTISQSIPNGSVSDIDSVGAHGGNQVIYHPTDENKFVFIWKDANAYGRAVVGTVNGTSISLGTSVVFESSSPSWMAFTFDKVNTNKFVIAYYTGGWPNLTGKAIVGTVSGTSLSFGTATSFAPQNGGSNYPEKFDITSDPNNGDKYLLTYVYGSRCKLVVGTVSGTSISLTSHINVSSVTCHYRERGNTHFDPNDPNKFVVIYNLYSSYNGAIWGRVGTLSGTSVSWGSEYILESSDNNTHFSSAFSDTQGRFVITYKQAGSTGRAKACIISGTAISVGSAATFNSGGATYERAVEFMPNSSKFVVFYRDWGNSKYGTVSVGSVNSSGTSIGFGGEIVIQTKDLERPSLSFDPFNKGKFIMGFSNRTDEDAEVIFGQLTATTTNLTATNFLGITDSAISSGASGKVTIKGGLKSDLSSLTPNSVYYAQGNGIISTTSTAPAVRIGKALSSTTLNLEFNS